MPMMEKATENFLFSVSRRTVPKSPPKKQDEVSKVKRPDEESVLGQN